MSWLQYVPVAQCKQCKEDEHENKWQCSKFRMLSDAKCVVNAIDHLIDTSSVDSGTDRDWEDNPIEKFKKRGRPIKKITKWYQQHMLEQAGLPFSCKAVQVALCSEFGASDIAIHYEELRSGWGKFSFKHKRAVGDKENADPRHLQDLNCQSQLIWRSIEEADDADKKDMRNMFNMQVGKKIIKQVDTLTEEKKKVPVGERWWELRIKKHEQDGEIMRRIIQGMQQEIDEKDALISRLKVQPPEARTAAKRFKEDTKNEGVVVVVSDFGDVDTDPLKKV